MLKSYRWGGWVGGWVVAHKTLLSSPVPIGIGIWAGLGLDNFLYDNLFIKAGSAHDLRIQVEIFYLHFLSFLWP